MSSGYVFGAGISDSLHGSLNLGDSLNLQLNAGPNVWLNEGLNEGEPRDRDGPHLREVRAVDVH